MAKFKNIKRLVKRIIYTNLISENQLYLTPLLSGQHGIGKSMIIKQNGKRVNVPWNLVVICGS